MNYTISEIATLLNAQVVGPQQQTVGFLLTDSRSLTVPEETLFFALRTAHGDGHRYVEELYQRGVRSFVVEHLPDNEHQQHTDANYLIVPSPISALQQLANAHRRRYSIPVVGITGSNGKTVVKEWLSQVLAPQMQVTRSPKSYNSQVGVPLSLWLINPQTDIAIIEAGISQPGEMQRLNKAIEPTIAVLTNIGTAHQKNFDSLEQKYTEKLTLAQGVQAVAYCSDDPQVQVALAENHFEGEQLTWSFNDSKATLFVQSTVKGDNETTICYTWKGQPSQMQIPFIDDAAVQNAVCVALVALHLGVSTDQLQTRMPHLEPVAMRLEVKEGLNLCTLINDSYNSDIHSLDIALDFMSRRPDHEGRRRTLILSDMLQTGVPPEQLYRQVALQLETRKIDKFIGVGRDLKAWQELFHVPEQHFFDTVEQLIESPLMTQFHTEVILIKGARRFGFDRLADLLAKKVHETLLEVNLKALVSNLNFYRSYLRPETKLACMIKADGYGTGAVEVAKTLQEHRVDYLAVAVADEGASLRRNGITANIMIMNPELSSFKTLFDYHLEPEIYSFRLLEAMIQEAEREGITNYPVHLKIDTGMHRLGFDPDNDIERLVSRLKSQSALMPRSVFSHFVGADSDDFDDFSALQFERFDRASKQIMAQFDHKILRHMDNSAGITHFPERQMDMCRLGLGLYGINPRDNKLLSNVATLKTTILQMRHVKAGDSVGYSRKTVLDHDSVIAAIPIGYADGLFRALGNRNGYCLVNGQKAYYVGNICMDVAMIDVTDIPCHEGDSVEIFGNNLSIGDLAERCGTIPYELLTAVSPRVKRIYYEE